MVEWFVDEVCRRVDGRTEVPRTGLVRVPTPPVAPKGRRGGVVGSVCRFESLVTTRLGVYGFCV